MDLTRTRIFKPGLVAAAALAAVSISAPGSAGGAATADQPPKVSFVVPAEGATLPSQSDSVLVASASDDHKLTVVGFHNGDRLLCAVKQAPYVCRYRPRGVDVGRRVLIAVAQDDHGQTSIALRHVTVAKFAPRTLALKVGPRRDRRAPFSFRARGSLSLPRGVTTAEGCSSGIVQVLYRSGQAQAFRVARIKADCSFKTSMVRFRDRKLLARSGRIKVRAHYYGNGVLGERDSARVLVRSR
jgi:Big-like domain-containing protein